MDETTKTVAEAVYGGESGSLTIRRVPGQHSRLRAAHISIDNEARAKLKETESTSLLLRPGRHLIRVNVDWITSRPLTVEVPTGGEVVVEFWAKGTVGQLTIDSVFHRDRGFTINVVEPKAEIEVGERDDFGVRLLVGLVTVPVVVGLVIGIDAFVGLSSTALGAVLSSMMLVVLVAVFTVPWRLRAR